MCRTVHDTLKTTLREDDNFEQSAIRAKIGFHVVRVHDTELTFKTYRYDRTYFYCNGNMLCSWHLCRQELERVDTRITLKIRWATAHQGFALKHYHYGISKQNRRFTIASSTIRVHRRQNEGNEQQKDRSYHSLPSFG